MAIALVSKGAVANTTTTTITPAFGQATAAGNMLIALVGSMSTSASNPISTPTGWTLINSLSGGFTGAIAMFAIYTSSASTAAPSFTCTGAATMYAELTEWSGSSGLDQSSTVSGNSGMPTNIALGANDVAANELAITASVYLSASGSSTATFSRAWTPTGGTVVTLGDYTANSIAAFGTQAYLVGSLGGTAIDQNAETATLSSGTSGSSCVIASFKVVAGQAAPTNLTATASSTTNINLAWTAPGSQTSYTIDRATDNAFSANLTSFTGIAAAATTYADATVVANTTYYYRIKAIGSLGTSTNSNTATASTSPPAAPTNLSGTPASGTQMNLTWTAPAGTITSYTLDRALDTGFTSSLTTITGISSASYNDTTVVTNTTYYYRVRAVGPTGTGANSTTATTSTTAPNAPSSLIATGATTTSMTVSWTAPSTGNVPTSYTLDRALDQAFSNTLVTTTGITSTSTSVTGLTQSTTYYYRVRAVNAVGTGSNSASNQFATMGPAITLGTANLGTATVTGATSATITTSAAITAGQALILVVANHAANTVSSITGTFTGTWTISNSSTTPNLTIAYCLNAPASASGVTVIVNVSSSSGFATALSSFNNVITTTTAAIDNAIAYKANASGTNTTPSITPTVNGDLIIAAQGAVETGIAYTYTNVAALNLASNGGTTSTKAEVVSAYAIETTAAAITATLTPGTAVANETGIVSFKAAAAPNAPTNFAASAASTTQVNTSWTAPTGQAITSYTVDRALDSGFTSSLTSFTGIASGATSYNDTTAVANTTYYYRVKAINSLGTSPNSNSASATTSLPTAPTNLVATAGTSTQASLTWTASTGQSSYTLTRATDTGFTANVGTVTGISSAATSYTDSAPFRSTWYYKLQGVNGVGAGTASNTSAGVVNIAGDYWNISSGGMYTGSNSIHLSDGTLVFLSVTSTTARSLYYYTHSGMPSLISTINGTGFHVYESYSICRDLSDNIYVLFGTQTPGLVGQAFTKGSGYTWTAQSQVAASEAAGIWTQSGFWCNTTGGTNSAGHILLASLDSSGASYSTICDAGVLLAGTGTLITNQTTKPTFLGAVETSASGKVLDLAPDSTWGATSGLSIAQTTTTSVSVGSWSVTSAGALGTNSLLSGTITTQTATSSSAIRILNYTSGGWAVITNTTINYSGATQATYQVARYSSTAQLTAATYPPAYTNNIPSSVDFEAFLDPVTSNKIWIIGYSGAPSSSLSSIGQIGCSVGSGVAWDSTATTADTISSMYSSSTGSTTFICVNYPKAVQVDWMVVSSNAYGLMGDYVTFAAAASTSTVFRQIGRWQVPA